MKAYKVTLLIIDHDELGADEIKVELENTKYANYCISPNVMEVEEAEIGEWDGDHPLNQRDGKVVEFKKLFSND